MDLGRLRQSLTSTAAAAAGALFRTQPLGVLHDLLAPRLPLPAAADTQQQQQQQACSLSAPAAPWCLTVHYRNMPASLSNSWQNAGTAKDYFFSSLKVGLLLRQQQPAAAAAAACSECSAASCMR
jgi:hypothetical protein